MDLLERLVVRAVAEYGDTAERLFASVNFAHAVREEFQLASRPDGRWCETVLSRLPYVVPAGGDQPCWMYRQLPESAQPAATAYGFLKWTKAADKKAL